MLSVRSDRLNCVDFSIRLSLKSTPMLSNPDAHELRPKILCKAVEAIRHYATPGHASLLGSCLRYLGEIYRMQEQYDSALAMLAEAQELYTVIGDTLEIAGCLVSSGESTGRRTKSATHSGRSLRLESCTQTLETSMTLPSASTPLAKHIVC